MRKLIFVAAALCAIAWSGVAWAVVSDTTVTATVSNPPPPPEPGQTVQLTAVVKTTSGKSVDVPAKIEGGKVTAPVPPKVAEKAESFKVVAITVDQNGKAVKRMESSPIPFSDGKNGTATVALTEVALPAAVSKSTTTAVAHHSVTPSQPPMTPATIGTYDEKYKVYLDVDVGSSDFNTNGVSGSGAASGSATQWGVGAGFRAQAPWFDRWFLAAGVAGDATFSGASTALLDLGPGIDARVKWQRDGFISPYLGVGRTFPTISSEIAGRAWQPGWGTFDVTLFAGPGFQFVSGSVATTDQTNFSRTLVGLTAGIDVDYPLYVSGYGSDHMGPLWPRWHVGASVDTFPGFNVDTGVGDVHMGPKTDFRVYTGLTWATSIGTGQ